MDDLNITLIQSSLHWENTSANYAMFSEKINSIPGPTDLILLPEMFSTGFTMNAASLAEPMDGPGVEWMKKIAQSKNCSICGSLIIGENNFYYNRLVWVTPDGSVSSYDKRHLFRLAREQETYSAGSVRIVPEIKGWKILPLVCYDLRFPVWSRRTSENDYDLLLYVANWPDQRIRAWDVLLPARAVENQCYVAGLNRTGKDGNNISHPGHSAVYDYMGNPTWIAGDTDCIQTVSLNKEPLRKFREQFAFWRDAERFSII